MPEDDEDKYFENPHEGLPDVLCECVCGSMFWACAGCVSELLITMCPHCEQAQALAILN